MQLGPFVGLAGTVVGMQRTFSALGNETISAAADPSHLSAAIGEVLYATAAGLVIGLLGAVFILLAVQRFGCRAPWLYWVMLIAGCLHLLTFPIGTIIGILLLVVALGKRSEFFPSRTSTRSPIPP